MKFHAKFGQQCLLFARMVVAAIFFSNCNAAAQENRIENRIENKSGNQEAVREIAGAPASINEGFLDPELRLDDWVARFELESREIFASRNEIIKHIDLSSGKRIADIGAGTGFFTIMFASAVGETGQVYAVDISTRFLEHIAKQSEITGQRNISPVLASSACSNLPPDSVDAVFVCDTYHHFEHPGPTLDSIYRAMVPGGRFYLIDFERIPGKSRPWLMDHIREGKEACRAEVEAAGFQFVKEIRISTFAENYFLSFQKPDLPEDGIDCFPRGDWNVSRRR